MKRIGLTLAIVLCAAGVFADEPEPRAKGDKMELRGWWDLRFWRDDSGDAPPAKMVESMDDLGGDGDFGLELDEPGTKKPEKKKVETSALPGAGPREPVLPKTGDVWGGFRWPHHWYSWTMTSPEIGDVRRLPPNYRMSGSLKQQTGCWLRRRFTLPEEWKGKTVLLNFPNLMFCDAVVYINGKRVGTVLRPNGEIDITSYLKGTGKEEIIYFITYDCKGITRGSEDYFGAPGGDNKGRFLVPSDACPYLRMEESVFFSDLFCNTSWRKKTLTLEVEVFSSKDHRAAFSAEIVDADGKVVRTAEQDVELKKGSTSFAVPVPWTNPITWEFRRGYMYTCRAKVSLVGKPIALKDQRFGFREIWREGKEIMMNGHPQRLRPVYSFNASQWGADFLCSIGYNCLHFSHGKDTAKFKEADLDFLDEQGIGVICAGPQIMYGMQPGFVKSESVRKDYERIMKNDLKKLRNHPSVITMYLGVNAPYPMMPIWQIWWHTFGKSFTKDVSAQAMNMACEIGHKANPNILFYGHADGNDGDIASMNIYFNFTPWQERDEWLESWSRNGVLPVQAAEFGEVYWLCWHGGEKTFGFMGTEYAAIEYGDEAYALETDGNAAAIRKIPGWGGGILMTKNEAVWKYRTDLVRRNHRSWRGWGLNGGLVWFNLSGYGSPRKDGGPGYGPKEIPEKIVGRPKWVNRDYDIFREGNQDFLAFIGGDEKHTDRTHAYWEGEPVKKKAMLIWDGFGERKVRGKCSLFRKGENSPVATVSIDETLKQGDIRRVPIEFKVPGVSVKTAFEIRLEAECDGFEIQRDTFAVEIYPKRKSASGRAEVALYDPLGETAGMLDVLGIKYRKVEDISLLSDVKNLIVGRFALGEKKNADESAEIKEASIRLQSSLQDGAKALVMAQYPDAWQAFGLKPIDPAPRRLFPRAGAFKSLSADTLSYWRGNMQYGDKPWCGSFMKHSTGRGPRGGYNHAVAAFVLKTPDAPGYMPLADGEFDMGYSGVLWCREPNRAWLFSTLDLEGRVGVDPAATAAAEALLDEFMSEDYRPAVRGVVPSGASAERLAKEMSASAGKGGILLVGPDSPLKWSDIATKAKDGVNVVVYANPGLIAQAGFKTGAAKKVYRFAGLDSPSFAGVGPSLLRARDYLYLSALSHAPEGWKLSSDGYLAECEIGKGRVVYCAVDPFEIADRYAGSGKRSSFALPGDSDDPTKMDDKARKRNAVCTALSAERARDLYARILTNLGATAPSADIYATYTESFDPYVFKYW